MIKLKSEEITENADENESLQVQNPVKGYKLRIDEIILE